MLANPVPLKISDFTNPSGQVVFRVSGTLRNGKRVRRNFKDATQAQDYVNGHAQRAPGAVLPRPVITVLPDQVVRAAEAAVQRLPAGTDLAQAVEFFATNFRPLQSVTIKAAAAGFRHWLETQRKIKPETGQRRESTVLQFAKHATITETAAISPERAKAWIYDPECSDRTQRDHFDWLNGFCAWAVREKHLAANVVSGLDRPVVSIDAPGVLTFDETWTLLMAALTDAEGPQMLPFFAICVLSGVRPAEVPRLEGWADIYLDDEHRVIEVNKAKGGRSRRQVSISEPLWRILTWCKAQGLAPHFFSKRKFNRIRRRAGLLKRWEKDLCRHTHASHHYIVFKDTKTLTADMGNSEHVLFQVYIRPVPLTDGNRMRGLVLHYSAPREKSAEGTGPKPRRAKALPQ